MEFSPFRTGKCTSCAVFIAAARVYRVLLEAHKEFDRLEETRIGTGKHEAFHRLIETLEASYSSKFSCASCKH